MKRMLAVFAVSLLAACAAPQTREQTLVGRAVDAMGGADWRRTRSVDVPVLLR